MVHRTPFFLPSLFPSSLVWRVPEKQPVLYLTFDDGPINGPTDFVLETLAEYNAYATFFCIGDNIRKHELVFRRTIDGGHAVGNHTYNHLNGWKTSLAEYKENTIKCEDAIRAHMPLRVSMPLFRPPYGRISRSQIRALSKDFRIVMWDVLTMDYRAGIAPEKCLRGSINATRPGSVVVFHDSFKAEKNLTFALPRFLEHFSNLGYSFKRLSTT